MYIDRPLVALYMEEVKNFTVLAIATMETETLFDEFQINARMLQISNRKCMEYVIRM